MHKMRHFLRKFSRKGSFCPSPRLRRLFPYPSMGEG